jgi:TNF receptor-associated protein 1
MILTWAGMSKEELVDNLGTIARSGSKAFLNKLKGVAGDGAAGAKDSIIGQFGVGFYAGFMVGKRITVTSQSYVSGAQPHVWASEGTGEFDVTETQG